ncbi:MAG TPA: hypothetical protein VFX76_07290 [Roseiflexaceae bacterium]|nr:hypothetical protein [Roseiflexaceae bacterium]
MKSHVLRWFAIALILETGLLHLMAAQTEYEAAAYVGYLFAANFFGALIAAYAIHRRQVWGWALGAIIAALSIAGYAWSRTLGLPGVGVEEWFSPYGIVSLGVEGLFLLLALARPWQSSTAVITHTGPSRLRSVAPVLSLCAVAITSGCAYQWDAAATLAYGSHVSSLAQLRNTPALSSGQLVDQYGVQISLVANSMRNSIVDVRLRIVDPDKAHLLLQNQAALMVGKQELIVAPHMHSHAINRVKAGTQYIVFFPAGRTVRPGSSVSIVFGPVSVEPVVVQ